LVPVVDFANSIRCSPYPISNGTRTEEGSAAYAATMSVLETCRRCGVDAWAFITDLLADARRGLPHRAIPLPA
jgi:transposase